MSVQITAVVIFEGIYMDFDLRTTDSAYSFVLDTLGITGEQFIDEYIIACDRDYERLWEKYYRQLKHIDASKIRVWAFHITGSLDHCQSIMHEGLRNLHHALSSGSKMADVFQKYGLEFDVGNKVMYFNGIAYDVDYQKYRNRCNLYGKDELLSRIAHRLCKDFCVNGFMCNDDFRSYGFDICIRPEFILDLVNMFPELSELDLEWRRCSTSYKVNFFAYLDQLERYNFDLDEYRDPPYARWDDLDDNDKAIKWMIGRAIDRAFDELGDTYLYVRSNFYIPAEQIDDCERI